MKILILANNDMGLYKFRKELLERLVKMHMVYICLPDGEFIENLQGIGCHFIECKDLERHGTNPLQDLKLMFFYRKIMKDIKPDIVLTYTIKPNVYGGMVCAQMSIPYVANITGLGTAVENPGVLQRITLFLYRLGLSKAKKVFFQNKDNMNFMLEHHVVNDTYELIPGSGVNLSQYELLEYPNGETVEFIFVGRIMQQKGVEQYFDAAEYIRHKYPYTRFHVCGFCEEDYKDRIEQLDRDGIIEFHGVVSDMKEIYKQSSCTIHPSYYPEGLSNVLLESAACGRPIITTDRSGCREVIDDEVNGYIIRQKDSQDLIEKIEKFLTLSAVERKQMGLAGRKKVEKEFSREIVVNKYLLEIQGIK